VRISSKFSRAYDPARAKADGHVPIWIHPGQFSSDGKTDSLDVGDYKFLPPVAEGSRVGDGTGLSDPYAYENDGVTLHDYRPRATGGVIPSTWSLRSRATGNAGPGAYVDDPNTGLASQAPLTPASLLVATADDGADGGIVPTMDQPRTVVQIAMWQESGINPGLQNLRQVVELNGPNATGDTTDIVFYTMTGGRLLKENSAGDFTIVQPLNPIPPKTWAALIYRLEATAIQIYNGVTGEPIATNELVAGTYNPESVNPGGTVVHTMLGRRYSAIGPDPTRLRERVMGDVQVQEWFCDNRLVSAKRISGYLNNRYPGLAQAVGYSG
jgi:hypothetical protein